VANVFVGLIVGYTWRKIFNETEPEEAEAKREVEPEPGKAGV
jgi:hypothetical protein